MDHADLLSVEMHVNRSVARGCCGSTHLAHHSHAQYWLMTRVRCMRQMILLSASSGSRVVAGEAELFVSAQPTLRRLLLFEDRQSFILNRHTPAELL